MMSPPVTFDLCKRASFDLNNNLELPLIDSYYKLFCMYDYEFSNVLCYA